MKMKMTLLPVAGLCNRMRAIVSAMAWHKIQNEVELEIFWENSWDCGAYFHELFEQPQGYKINEVTKFYMRPGNKRNLFLPDILKRMHYDKILYINESDRYNFEERIAGAEKVYVAAYNYFTPYEIKNSLSNIFIPTQELQKAIDRMVAYYSEYTVGVHVRRTDNYMAIKSNPLEKFYELMDKELDINKNTRFYLATDSEEVKKLMYQRYGNSIITQRLSLTRNNSEGMKDAVIDLFCLGSTQKIIGCRNSTYSILASQLYNIELIR